MKITKTFKLVLLVVLTATIFSSCSKDNNSSTQPTNQNLFETLKGHTWLTNACFQSDDGYTDIITFKSDGTWAGNPTMFQGENWLSGEYPTTFYISSSQQIILKMMVRKNADVNQPLEEIEEYFGPPVASYSSSTITFMQLSDCVASMTKQ